MTEKQQKKALALLRRLVSDGDYEGEDYVLCGTVPDPEWTDEDGEPPLVPEVVRDTLVFLREIGEITW